MRIERGPDGGVCVDMIQPGCVPADVSSIKLSPDGTVEILFFGLGILDDDDDSDSDDSDDEEPSSPAGDLYSRFAAGYGQSC